MAGPIWILLAATQAAPALKSEEPAQALKIDILVRQPQDECAAKTTDEIVVCADRFDNESQRLRPIAKAEIYEKDESKAEFSIAENVRMAAEVESNQLGAGVISKAIMARVKIKF